jgi:hypothetical protein
MTTFWRKEQLEPIFLNEWENAGGGNGGMLECREFFLFDQLADGLNYAQYDWNTQKGKGDFSSWKWAEKMAFILNIKRWNMSRDES